METYRAVVIGATGAVGSALVRDLLASPRCAEVTALARRPVQIFGTSARRVTFGCLIGTSRRSAFSSLPHHQIIDASRGPKRISA